MDDSKLQVHDDSQVYFAPYRKSVLHPKHVKIFLIVSHCFMIYIYIIDKVVVRLIYTLSMFNNVYIHTADRLPSSTVH